MFLPAMRPREIAGQRLSIRGTYLGCAVVNTDSGPLAGLLFRDTGDIFICHAEPAGDDAALVVTNVGDRAASEIKDFRSTVASLMERIEQDRQTLAMKDAAITLLQTGNRELQTLADAHATEIERINGDIALWKESHRELDNLKHDQIAQIDYLKGLLEKAEMVVNRYETLVGPLETEPEPPPILNAVLDFGETAELPKKAWSAANPPPVDSDLL